MPQIACNASDWAEQSAPGQRPICHTCLTTGQAIGLAFSTQAGVISFISVLTLFAIVLVKYYLASPDRRAGLFGYLDIFMINLFLSELLMSLGGMLDAKWANEAQVYCGGYCNAQGTLQFLGETSVSIWTLLITLYTWWIVTNVRRLVFRPLVCYGIVAAVWVYVFAFNFGSYASVSPVNDDDPSNYFTPTPFWCWINPNYGGKRYGEYVWLWIAGAGNIVVYVPLYLILRGNLVLGNSLLSAHLYWTPPPRDEPIKADSTSVLSAEDDEEPNVRKDASKLLWYPVVYTVLVLPLSIVRWMGTGDKRFADPQIPKMASLATAQLVFHALYRLSGVINVGLVLGTRPNVLLLGKRDREDEDREDDRIQHVNGDRNAGSMIPLRQRTNTTQSGGENNTGFGGPAVNLARDEGLQ